MRLAAFSHTIYYIYIYIYIYLNICWSERSTIRLTSLDPQIHLNKIPALMKTRMLSEDHGSKRSSIFFWVVKCLSSKRASSTRYSPKIIRCNLDFRPKEVLSPLEHHFVCFAWERVPQAVIEDGWYKVSLAVNVFLRKSHGFPAS